MARVKIFKGESGVYVGEVKVNGTIIASQGSSRREAKKNTRLAEQLYKEVADISKKGKRRNS